VLDVATMLLEENWVHVPCTQPCTQSPTHGVHPNPRERMVFKKKHTDYDVIEIQTDGARGLRLTVPLRTSVYSYTTHFQKSIDMYVFVCDFLEYYAEA
jgi:hypothetical protein